MTDGEGAVIAVPAHAPRDHAFARRYDLPIQPVVAPAEGAAPDPAEAAFTEPSVLVETGEFTGMTSEAPREATIQRLEADGRRRRRTQYRLCDWGVSRQRDWRAAGTARKRRSEGDGAVGPRRRLFPGCQRTPRGSQPIRA